MKVTREQLVEYLVDSSGMRRSEARKAVGGAVAALRLAIASGNDVFIRGLGTFKVRTTKEKKARNVHDGVAVVVPPRKAVKFIPGKKVKEELNGGEVHG